MKILVTGGSGYVGKAFVERATQLGHTVTLFGHWLTLPEIIKGIQWQNFDALVHLAAAGVRRDSPTRTWEDCMAVNFAGTRDLLQSLSASKYSIPVFIAGSIREQEMRARPDYWHDPYIVSFKLRRCFVEEWAYDYPNRVAHPFVGRCNEDPKALETLCSHILFAIS